jgi:hypothetical protein
MWTNHAQLLLHNFFFLVWYWGLNCRSHICLASVLPLEPFCQPFFYWVFWR